MVRKPVLLARWVVQRVRFGFPEWETWNLDYTMLQLLYERVMFFVAHGAAAAGYGDLRTVNVTILGEVKTVADWVDELLTLATSVLSNGYEDYVLEDGETRRVWLIWMHIHPHMWD